MSFPVRFILVALAIYRLAVLLTKEDGPMGIFARIREKLAVGATGAAWGSFRWSLAELAHCPYCAAFWMAPVGVFVLFWPSLASDLIVAGFAMLGLQAFLTDHSNLEE